MSVWHVTACFWKSDTRCVWVAGYFSLLLAGLYVIHEESAPSTPTCVFSLVPSLVEDVLSAVPHVPPGLISRELGLVQLGGNSLCASRLSEALRARHGLELSVPWLLKSTLGQVEQHIGASPVAVMSEEWVGFKTRR